MNLLVFKLIVTPLLLLCATLAVRRRGEALGGFMVGLPLTSGPISAFLALEHGQDFARQATTGSLTATVAQAGFCLTYCKLARRGCLPALGGACLAFTAIALLLRASGVGQTALFVMSAAAVSLALRFIPRQLAGIGGAASPWWDLPARMVLIAGLVAGVTGLAPLLGPDFSGVLASFPFMAIILTVFAHRASGHAAACAVMRGMAASLFGFACFFYVTCLTLGCLELPLVYGSATLCALCTQCLSLRRLSAVGTARA
ncbi:hypothetical protein [uncultured Aquitalea sp.]|uniref:hypothetical protein n=1 Tax=uncultured Aquitalea sp. TaxID=540272 RepID=UPI0025F32C7E|nr:hypothetical protein [uncultured Aquitalea sp.]